MDCRRYALTTAVADTETTGCARRGRGPLPMRPELLAPMATDEAEIRDALSRACWGSTVLIAAGWYKLSAPLIAEGKALTLFCERGGTATLEYVGGPALECRDCVVRLERVHLIGWTRKYKRLRTGFLRTFTTTSSAVLNELPDTVLVLIGVLLSFMSSFAQGITAITVVGAAYLLLRGTTISMTDINP